ncbi:MAG: lipoyl(octanoyl) transferase LipB [Burkholderiaceae bacterium]
MRVIDIAADARPVRVRSLGVQPYAATRDAMIAFTTGRDEATDDEIWLLEHAPVYTLGQAGRLEHLLHEVDIPVVHTERGGQITYHGPGQLIAYLLIDLRRRGIKVREFVQVIEQSVIETLAAYNLAACTRPGAPGVYVVRDDTWQKVAALGLKIVNGRSFHGVSLNVDMNLAPYAAIDACGYPGLASIDLRSLGVQTSPTELGPRLASVLAGCIDQASR